MSSLFVPAVFLLPLPLSSVVAFVETEIEKTQMDNNGKGPNLLVNVEKWHWLSLSCLREGHFGPRKAADEGDSGVLDDVAQRAISTLKPSPEGNEGTLNQ